MKPTSSIGRYLLAPPVGTLEITNMPMSLRERVLSRLEALGIGPVAAATRAGLKHTYIRDIVKEGGKQTVNVRFLPALAEALQTTPAFLNGETDDPALPTGSPEPTEVRASGRELITIPRVGRVEAGEYREAPEYRDLEREFLLDEIDDEFPRARMMAYDVLGDSMDRADPPIPPGSTIICVDFEDTRLPHVDGQIVVVERTRNGGLTREWSVKEVVTFDDRTEFHPRSSSDRHQPIVMMDSPDADDGVRVSVLALVRRISTPVPRSKPKRR